MNINALSLIHKLIRKQAFDLALYLLRAEPAQGQEIQKKLNAMATLLGQHAAHEDELFAPSLEGESPESASRMKAEHAEHEEDLRRLGALVAEVVRGSGAGVLLLHQLHLDFNCFLARMLQHLDREERDWAPGLHRVVPSIEGLAATALTLPEAEKDAFLKDLESVSTPSEWARLEPAQRGGTSS